MARASQGTYTIKDLLTYSSVCGIGLDTVPIPGGCALCIIRVYDVANINLSNLLLVQATRP